MTSVEFPKDSGQWADYTPEEREIMRSFAHAVKRGEIPLAQAHSELLLIHAAKVVLGAIVSTPVSSQEARGGPSGSKLTQSPTSDKKSVRRAYRGSR